MRMRFAGRSFASLFACSCWLVSGLASAQQPAPAAPQQPGADPDPPPAVAQPAPAPAAPYYPGYAPAPTYAPGYPPPGYPAPGYGAPYVVARPAPPPAVPWVINDWDPEAPAPPGFHKAEGMNNGLITRGAVLLGSAWVASVLTATVGSSTDSPDRRAAWTPFFVPLAGPYIAAGTLKPTRGGDIGAIALDAGVQTVGALGILVGVLDSRAKLVRYDANAPTPAFTPNGSGGGPRAGFITAGAILGGIGTLALLAGGITWLVAASDSALLSHDCPHHGCVRGTPGGDELVTARKTSRATDVLVGGGLPAAGVGYSLLILGSGFGKGQVHISPSVGANLRGASITGSF
jgi:hypothetical protein